MKQLFIFFLLTIQRSNCLLLSESKIAGEGARKAYLAGTEELPPGPNLTVSQELNEELLETMISHRTYSQYITEMKIHRDLSASNMSLFDIQGTFKAFENSLMQRLKSLKKAVSVFVENKLKKLNPE